MGSVSMTLYQVLLVVVLLHGVSCDERETEENLSVVGIPTSQSHEKVQNNVIIDTKVPHSQRRKKLVRIRNSNNSDSVIDDTQGKRSRNKNIVKRMKALRFKTKHEDTSKKTTTVKGTEGFGTERPKSRIRSRLSETTVSTMETETFEDSSTSAFKMKPTIMNSREKVMDNFSSNLKKSFNRINTNVNTAIQTVASSSSTITSTTAKASSLTVFMTTSYENIDTNNEITAASTTFISTSTDGTTSRRSFWRKRPNKVNTTTKPKASLASTISTTAARTPLALTFISTTTEGRTLRKNFWEKRPKKVNTTTKTTDHLATSISKTNAGTTSSATSIPTKAKGTTLRKSFWQKRLHKLNTTTIKTASTTTSITKETSRPTPQTSFWQRTALLRISDSSKENAQQESEETTEMLKSTEEESRVSNKTTFTPSESLTSRRNDFVRSRGSLKTDGNKTIIPIESMEEGSTNASTERITAMDNVVEFVTKLSGKKSNERKKWAASKKIIDQKKSEIEDPVVEEKSPRPNIRQKSKMDDIKSRRHSTARSSGTLRKDGKSEANNGHLNKDYVSERDSLSGIRSRNRMPAGLQHRFGSTFASETKNPADQKNLKRIRMQNNNQKVAIVETRSNKQTAEVDITVKRRKMNPSRSRLSTVQRAPSPSASPLNNHSTTQVQRMRNPAGRRGHSKTTSTRPEMTTTEKITIRPDAHKIRYTSNKSEYVDISLESPISEIKKLSELSYRIDQEPKELFAEEYIIAGPILDNIFRQAAQQANGKSSQPAPIFVAGTIKPEDSLLDNIFSQAAQQANGKYVGAR